MSQECNVSKGLFIGFFSGIVVGAAVALLYAPKSGKKLRRDINNKAQDLKEDAEEFINSAKEKALDVINDGRLKIEHLVSDAKNKADDLLKDANRFIEDTKGAATKTNKK